MLNFLKRLFTWLRLALAHGVATPTLARPLPLTHKPNPRVIPAFSRVPSGVARIKRAARKRRNRERSRHA